MTGFIDAVTFLTRVPLPTREHDDATIARAIPWFPIVGAGVGLVVAGVYAGALFVLPGFLAAGIAVACGLCVTGALHEDGLGDTADAFGGGRDREDRLRILKDPRLGTFGVLAVALSLLLRAGAVATFTRAGALLAIPAAHAMSRSASIAAMLVFRPIDEGMGAAYTRALGRVRGLAGVVVGVGIAAVLLRGWAVPAVAIGFGAALVVGRLARAKIGGINGDVLGAVQQITEVGILLLAVGRVT